MRVLSRGGAGGAPEVDPDFERELGELVREHQGGAGAAAPPPPPLAPQVRALLCCAPTPSFRERACCNACQSQARSQAARMHCTSTCGRPIVMADHPEPKNPH